MEPTSPSDPLVALARAHGVATDYWDWQGCHAPIAATTIVAVLAALGIAAQTSDQVESSLLNVDERAWRRTLPPTVVTREGWSPWVPVHVRDGDRVTLTIDLEDGRVWEVTQIDHLVPSRQVDGVEVGEATFELPWNLPLGWHRLVAHLDAAALDPTSTTATLVVTPHRLDLPAGLDDRRAVGLAAQLYQVRSRRSWGSGDLGDLADLGAWAADAHGADFVLVNPLHAAEPVAPMEPSPYLPTTRRFMNPLYLRVEDVHEMSRLEPISFEYVQGLAARGHALNDSEGVDRDAAWALKRQALGLLHAVGLTGARARDYRRFRETQGEGLTAYATWCALAETHGLPWTAWGGPLRDPASAEVATFREEHAALVDLHCWMQWLLAEQVRLTQSALRRSGMRLGIIEDLAVGVAPDGADAWGLADVLARGVTAGAPPDQFNQLGQNWDQPPWRPDRLAEQGYQPFQDMVRAALRDSGGLRIDHVIGLFRLWWVPDGLTPDQGAYVRYDHEALIGILVLEAQRAGAVVIGEDLGVVEPSARDYLLERGILGTSILWFEWDGDTPRPPESYRRLCLSSVTTHDLPPTAGYLGLEHVAIRERLGLLTRTHAQEEAAELTAINRVRDALVDRGLLDPRAAAAVETAQDEDAAASTGSGEVSVAYQGERTVDEVVALHRWLAQSDSRMLAVALADLVGDRQAVNQPGTIDDYPNWRVPLTGPSGILVTLEDITSECGADGATATRIFQALQPP
ncbi:4-alpha-glucanotransferase [Lapillicoccus sp.]|uniref:4-alpha-glucanotransferase n=1 Tax=Lapillicoccus sp. TaxID=1909287 RepID=UPI0032658CD0